MKTLASINNTLTFRRSLPIVRPSSQQKGRSFKQWEKTRLSIPGWILILMKTTFFWSNHKEIITSKKKMALQPLILETTPTEEKEWILWLCHLWTFSRATMAAVTEALTKGRTPNHTRPKEFEPFSFKMTLKKQTYLYLLDYSRKVYV